MDKTRNYYSLKLRLYFTQSAVYLLIQSKLYGSVNKQLPDATFFSPSRFVTMTFINIF